MKRIFLAICLMAAATSAYAIDGATIIHQWNRTVIETIMEDGFAPPVAARIHAYMNLAGYQAGYRGSDGYRSLVGQLNGFKTCPMPEAGKTYDWRVAVVSAYQAAAKKLVYRIHMTDSLAKLQFEQLASEVASDVFDRSKSFGIAVGNAVNDYAKSDNYVRTQGLPDWEWPKCDSCWEPTPPNFAKPAFPYQSQVRTIVLTSPTQIPVQGPIPFSKEKGSDFWKAANEVYEIRKNLTDEQKAIALHWNDNPIMTEYHGHFIFNHRQITPGGHWMNIAMQLLQEDRSSMVRSMEVYSLTAFALFDAFTSCWTEKYRAVLIRPVTYINRYIDAKWEPLLQTPPFPEHSGGHSTITAAAAEVLTHYFGDNKAFVDHTEEEFELPARAFKSLREAAQEASISRVYGGIHYRRGCDAGNAHGTKIGQYIVQKVQCK